MKVQTNKLTPEFTPFEITIQFESLQEVLNIANLLQCNHSDGVVISAAVMNGCASIFNKSVTPSELQDQMSTIYQAILNQILKYRK